MVGTLFTNAESLCEQHDFASKFLQAEKYCKKRKRCWKMSYQSQWATKTFVDWQLTRMNKKDSEEPSSSVRDTPQIQNLETNILDMTVESLHFWL